MSIARQNPWRTSRWAALRCSLCAIAASVALAFPALTAERGFGPPRQGFPPMGNIPVGPQWVDTHVHLDGKMGRTVDFEGAAQATVTAMDQMGIRTSFVLPPPQPPEHPNLYDCDLFLTALQRFPGRFAFLCGGGSLNPMIQQAPAEAEVTKDLRAKFEDQANAIIARGAAGFGEMTALHLSHFSRHPFELAPADHPLFLLLADIAAKHDRVIDSHMDAVAEDMRLPSRFASPPNLPRLPANVAAFERLLAHNRQAKIVWAHVGSDFTGHWTVALSRAMLEKHPNLYMSIRINPPGVPENSPFTGSRELKPEWLELLRAFPDRFVLGSDTFYGSPQIQLPVQRPPAQMMLMPLRMLLAKLPPDLVRKVAHENAARLYRLKD